MRTVGLVLFLAPLLMLARFGQAQQYVAEHSGSKRKRSVPEVVVQAFRYAFPTVPPDSVISWEYDAFSEKPDVPYAYQVVFKQHGLRGNAEFDTQGNLGEYVAEIAVGSLPVPVSRVSRTIIRKLLRKNAKQDGYTLQALVGVRRKRGTYCVSYYCIYIKDADGKYIRDECIFPNGRILPKEVGFR